MPHCSIAYLIKMRYMECASCAGRAIIKNGTGLLMDLRRRDIAPTGELAGLPARDAPKTSEVWPRSIAGEALLAKNPRFEWPAHKKLLNGIRTGFTRADAQRLLQVEDPDLSVAGFPGPRHVTNRLHYLLCNRIVYCQLDLGLRDKV